MSDLRERTVPTIRRGVDGEGPVYVSARVAGTGAEAVAFAIADGEIPRDYEDADTAHVLMRELDETACKIRGLDWPWWVECTTRARNPVPFWRIDVD